MLNLAITEKSQLNQLLDTIHDQRFDLNTLRHDSHQQKLFISFSREQTENRTLERSGLIIKRWSLPVVESVLQIKNVEHFIIQDPAQVGIYELNSIKYSERNNELTLKAEPTLTLRIRVSSLSLSLADTGKTLGRKQFRSL